MITTQSNAEKYSVLYKDAYEVLKENGKIAEGEEVFTHLEEYFTHIGDLAGLHAANIQSILDSDPTHKDTEMYNAGFATYAKYLMLPLEEEYFKIDANSRKITVPANYARNGVSVAGDQIAETLLFEIDRYFDFVDLVRTTIFVQWTNPAGDEGASWITMIDYDDKKLRFGWSLTDKITVEGNGPLKFSVRFFIKKEDKTITYSLNTLEASVSVKPALRINLEDFMDVDEPSHLFTEAIINGSDSGAEVLPNTPQIVEGYDLPLKAYLNEGAGDINPDAVELKLQAYTGDAGLIKYNWLYTDYETNKQSMIIDNVTLEMIETNDTTLKPNKRYYELVGEGSYEIYTGEEMKSGLYEQISILRIPATPEDEEPKKIAGLYTVSISNRVGTNESFKSSGTCEIPAPKDIIFNGDLPEEGTILTDGSAVLDLTGKILADDSHAELNYQWTSCVKENSEFIPVEGANNEARLTVATPGWYKLNVISSMNRASIEKFSKVCKVTNLPTAPIIRDMDPNNPHYTINASSTNGIATMIVDVAPFDDTEIDIKLLSEGLTYKWYRKIVDGESGQQRQEVSLSDSDVTAMEGNQLQIRVLAGEGKYFECDVINTLNGKVAISTTELFILSNVAV